MSIEILKKSLFELGNEEIEKYLSLPDENIELSKSLENKIKEIYKNSLLMAIATFPMIILIGGIICLLSYFMLGILPSAGVIIIAFLCWVGLMRFIIDFYAAIYIKRHFLKEAKESEK